MVLEIYGMVVELRALCELVVLIVLLLCVQISYVRGYYEGKTHSLQTEATWAKNELQGMMSRYMEFVQRTVIDLREFRNEIYNDQCVKDDESDSSK